MAADHGDATMASCVKAPWEMGDMPTVLAKLEESGSIYFHKSLARIPNRKFGQCASLALPVWFIREHGDKFEEWTLLRTQTSTKPWRVRCSVFKRNDSPQVKFMGGWKSFAAHNRLKEGASLVFVLNGNAISEFQVYIFRGNGTLSSNPQTLARKRCKNIDGAKVPQQTEENSYAGKHYLRPAGEGNIRETGDLSIGKKKAAEERWRVQTRHVNLEEQNSGAASEVLTGTERKGLASQHGTNELRPSFRRRIMPYNHEHGRFEVPASFVKTHGLQLQADDVELQGIHEESPVRIVTRQWGKQGTNQTRLFFKDGWSGFSKENSLHKPNFSSGSPKVALYRGWTLFAADNHLNRGDSLVFVLNVDARSDFQVYIFQGTGRSSSISQTPSRKQPNNSDGRKVLEQITTGKNNCADRQSRSTVEGSIMKTGDLFVAGLKKAVHESQKNLGEGNSNSDDDGQAPSPVHHVQERQCSVALTGYGIEQSSGAASEVLTDSERKGFASQHPDTNSLPSFRRRLSADNLRRGYIEIPTSFVRTHLRHLQDDVELQGIHQESSVRIVTCHWVKNREQWVRIHFKAGWRNFVKENGLQAGQELHLTLASDSFFVVRVV